MLSIDDTRNISFRKSGFGGYKPEDVDLFVDKIQISYKELFEENNKLRSEIEHLNKELGKYHEEESCIRNAILSAQKLADASIIDANNKAREILNDASKQANSIIDHAKSISEEELSKSRKLSLETENFRENLLKIYDEHIKLINQIPVITYKNSLEETEIPILSVQSAEEDSYDVSESDNCDNCCLNECDKTSEEILSDLEPDNSKYKDSNFGSDYKLNSSLYKNSYSNLFKS